MNITTTDISTFLYSKEESVVAYLVKMAYLERKDKLSTNDFAIASWIASEYGQPNDESMIACVREAKRFFSPPLTDLTLVEKPKFSLKLFFNRIFSI